MSLIVSIKQSINVNNKYIQRKTDYLYLQRTRIMKLFLNKDFWPKEVTDRTRRPTDTPSKLRQRFDRRPTPKIHPDISPTPPLNFTGRVHHKFDIWPQFSIPVAFDALLLQNGATWSKSNTSTLSDDECTSF